MGNQVQLHLAISHHLAKTQEEMDEGQKYHFVQGHSPGKASQGLCIGFVLHVEDSVAAIFRHPHSA